MTTTGGEMPSGRRRGKLPGMTPPPALTDSAPAKTETAAGESSESASEASEAQTPRPVSSESRVSPTQGVDKDQTDYSATRLVNFRLPAQLHDRYKRLLREVEDSDVRLRKPNLTELVIALLEEGPRTPVEVAAAIRAKRAAENDGG